jgi:hypothetical protein
MDDFEVMMRTMWSGDPALDPLPSVEENLRRVMDREITVEEGCQIADERCLRGIALDLKKESRS